MKLWIDDVRPAPEGYTWAKSVNDAKKIIQDNEEECNQIYNKIRVCICTDEIEEGSVEEIMLWEEVEKKELTLIDIDHDAGDYYVIDGGDYIELLKWLEERDFFETEKRKYNIRIHSMNPVGVKNMRRIIERNGWKEVRQ